MALCTNQPSFLNPNSPRGYHLVRPNQFHSTQKAGLAPGFSMQEIDLFRDLGTAEAVPLQT
jgi:hypothetical protein